MVVLGWAKRASVQCRAPVCLQMSMKPLVKRVLIGVGTVFGLALLGGGVFAWTHTSAFASSMDKVYDVPLPDIRASSEPEVVLRGKHLAHSLGACAASECHGADLAGGKPLEMGPVATLNGPNITPAGMGAVYTDGELARLLQHGIKKDGRSVRFMPVHETNWFLDDDVRAIVSYLRTVPPVERANGPIEIGMLGMILDRNDQFVLDVARRISHEGWERPSSPTPTAEYGRFIARACMGCHGETFSGGRMPGTPSSVPIPTNITPHATGIVDWSYEDFTRLLDTGVKKNGEKLNPFMPLDTVGNMNEVERQALWAYLRSLEPREFGQR